VLHLDDIRKTYHTGTFTQAALDGVTITFRDNEFVAVLGPSGSGKTTLLNIVGGLDHADSGDLVIDQVSTQEYADRDWDAYRNNRIGFVFQNYNLITHQTVLANVELALTLSGVGKAERTQRAKDALDQVGLTEHIQKLPTQLSGGQMQRVAIARALINDPEILLADEPTGALDSKTGLAVMGLLQKIAQDRLVVMVTHNPDLAARYATRTVSLSDGQVVGDTNPYDPAADAREAKPARRTSMSFFTAIALSFTNLMTKKGRTLMTSFAGSIGIIGIAAILALANGINAYIRSVEENTLSLYPLSIQTQGIDLTALLAGRSGSTDTTTPSGSTTTPAVHEVKMLTRMFSRINSNDLTSLKTFLDSPESGLRPYVNAIQYNYAVTPQIFASDTANGARQVNPNSVYSALGFGSGSGSFATLGMSADVFASLPDDLGLVTGQYDVVAGRWPKADNELLLVLTGSGGVSDFLLYAMGLRDPAQLKQMIEDMANGKTITTPTDTLDLTYAELLAVTFRLVNPSALYEYDPAYHAWADRSGDSAWMSQAVAAGEELSIVGIVKPDPAASATMLSQGLYYTAGLVRQVIAQSVASPIVAQQLASPEVDVFSGKTFAEEAKNPSMSNFDFSSMIKIDQDALTKLFTPNLSGFTPDLSALDINGILTEMPALPPPDLASILGGLSIQIDPTVLSTLMTQMLGQYLNDVYGVSPGDIGNLVSPTPTATPTTTTPPTTPPTTTPPSGPITGPVTGPGASGVPTVLPSGLPTVLPSGLPTSLPTVLPSGLPTALPTVLPSGLPTVLPSFPTTNEVIASFTDWFAQPAIQAQFTAGLLKTINSDQLTAQLTAALTTYMQQVMQTMLTAMMDSLQAQLTLAMQATMTQFADQMSQAMKITPEDFSKVFHFTMDPQQLQGLLMSMMNNQANTKDSNLRKLSYADLATPSSIDIYPKDFASKQQVLNVLDGYNTRMSDTGQDTKVITYTDIVGTLMTSVTDIISKVSAVLIAFVSISLVVSSIMIGVITYISVLERKKEIGILRAIGASKRDIGNVFNAETLIVGFVAGVMGVAFTVLLTVIVNPIIDSLYAVPGIARLPLVAAVALVAVSMFLTFIAGLIPSSAASRRDPVEALRSE